MIVAVDPGINTGSVVGVELGDEHRVVAHHEIDIGSKEPAVPAFTDALENVWYETPDVEKALIEFPHTQSYGRSNTAIMIGVCRVAAECGMWCLDAGLSNRHRKEVRLVRADHLRRDEGKVIPNSKRPRLYRRIFGNTPPDEHTRDAALMVAAEGGVI